MTLNMNFARMMTNDRYFVQHNILEPKNPPKKSLKKKKETRRRRRRKEPCWIECPFWEVIIYVWFLI